MEDEASSNIDNIFLPSSDAPWCSLPSEKRLKLCYFFYLRIVVLFRTFMSHNDV